MNVLKTCERNIFWLGKSGQTKTRVSFPSNVADTISYIHLFTDLMQELFIDHDHDFTSYFLRRVAKRLTSTVSVFVSIFSI